MRYQFYREHKYVSAALNDVERLIARTDFRVLAETDYAFKAFEALSVMLNGHADYENVRLHTLLAKKQSKVYEYAEKDHAHQEEQLLELKALFDNILKAPTEELKINLGYQLYLTYRKFVAENLLHLHEEETLILPELQRLYSDEELRSVEAQTYHVMSPEQIIQMLEILLPHMNPLDREAIFEDIRKLAPEKLTIARERLSLLI